MSNKDFWREKTAKIIERDNLIRHPEGGYYIQTYKSEIQVDVPARYTGESKRPESTKINYLLVENDFSAWHRVKSDETWRFKEGSSLTLHIIDRDGHLKQIKVGNPKEEIDVVGEYVVEYSQWFAASVNNSFSYVECEVRPGFMFDDFELGEKNRLIKEFPQYTKIIEKYSRMEKIQILKVSHSMVNV